MNCEACLMPFSIGMRLRVAAGESAADVKLPSMKRRRPASPTFNCKRLSYCLIITATVIYFIFRGFTSVLIIHREKDLDYHPFTTVNEILPNVCVAGIVRDVHKIQSTIWKSLFEMNCAHRFTIHMVVGDDVESSKEYQIKLWDNWRNTEEYVALKQSCAPLYILQEPNDSSGTGSNNRIDKISFLRDHQRQLLREYFGKRLNNASIIMLVDFDLFLLPQTGELVHIVDNLQNRDYPHDAVCAAGVTLGNLRRDSRNELWYYDTYSTVLLPDTFVHPLGRRLFPKFYQGENPSLVRSENQQFGNFTQADLMRYFIQEGIQSRTGQVRVRSCFGGLTVYRALKYLDTNCQYFLERDLVIHGDASTIMKYASSKDKRPCEHVVIHECLKRSLPRFDIALDPNMVTQWRKD